MWLMLCVQNNGKQNFKTGTLPTAKLTLIHPRREKRQGQKKKCIKHTKDIIPTQNNEKEKRYRGKTKSTQEMKLFSSLEI